MEGYNKMPKRKIKQIAASAAADNGQSFFALYALADDGILWRQDSEGFGEEVKPLPDSEETTSADTGKGWRQ